LYTAINQQEKMICRKTCSIQPASLAGLCLAWFCWWPVLHSSKSWWNYSQFLSICCNFWGYWT